MPTVAPFPEQLSTPRLTLRRYRTSDAAAIRRLIDSNRDRLLQDFPDIARGFMTIEASQAHLDDRATQWNERRSFCYGIWQHEGGELRGQLTVKNIVWNLPSAELSYFVGAAWARQGVATEAIAAVLSVAFELRAFSRIYVRVIASNTGSLALARKLGFQEEGLHRNEFRCGRGQIHDVHYLSMTDRDYRARHG